MLNTTSHRPSRVTLLRNYLKYTSLLFGLSLKMYALFGNLSFLYCSFGTRLKYNTENVLGFILLLLYLLIDITIYDRFTESLLLVLGLVYY